MRNSEIYKGRISSNRRGFAFVLSDDSSPDTFIPEREAKKVLHGDFVLFKKIKRGTRDRWFGKIIRVLEPGKTKILGRVVRNYGIYGFEPIQNSIGNFFSVEIPKDIKLSSDKIIECEVVRDQYGFLLHPFIFSSVLQAKPGRTIFAETAIRNHELPVQFPDNVKMEADLLSEKIDPSVISKRRDMRDMPFVTIDGQDAKDYDDAIFVEKKPDYFNLYVAIADVAEFVKPFSALDEEARNRGTSVYFSTFVLPMLPEKLSNNICSLKPDVDRLVVVVHCKIDYEGKSIYQEFFEAVICSKGRLNYRQVQDYYNTGKYQVPSEIANSLKAQKVLFDILYKARKERGALNIDGFEPRYSYDNSGRLISVDHEERNISQGVIEECMIFANVAIANFVKETDLQMIYRHHPEPESDKLFHLKEEAEKLNLQTNMDDNSISKLCNMILENTSKNEKKHYYSLIIKRAQSLAFYSASRSNHFGLALNSYTHFTSPIRRYCDLMVHRVLKAKIHGKASEEEPDLDSLCSMISRYERRAEMATRDELLSLKCEFMSNKIGEEFDGIVSAITDEGITVQIFSHSIEGFIPRSVGTKRRNSSRPNINHGSILKVVLQDVDVRINKIFFKLKKGGRDGR